MPSILINTLCILYPSTYIWQVNLLKWLKKSLRWVPFDAESDRILQNAVDQMKEVPIPPRAVHIEIWFGSVCRGYLISPVIDDNWSFTFLRNTI